MGLLSWIRRFGRRPEPDLSSEEPPPEEPPGVGAHWVSAEESRFGVEVLDCQEAAGSWIALTDDLSFGPKWVRLLASDGREYRGKSPEDPTTFECALFYPPHQPPPPEGPLFKSQEMEDRWHIYHFDSDLYFTRSWEGELIYRAKMEYAADQTHLRSVTAASGYSEDGARYCIESVHYLIASHLYGLIAVHPLPPRLGRDPAVLASFSFSEYGRRGLFGTFASTWELPCIRRAPRSDAAPQAAPEPPA